MPYAITRSVYLAWSGDLAESALRARLQEFGTIVDLSLRLDQNRRFAFCEYAAFEQAGALLDHVQDQGCLLVVDDMAVQVHARTPLEAAFVVGFPWATSQQEVYDLASQYGECTYVHLAMDSQGRSNGFAFIAYATLAQTQAAIAGFNGMVVGGRTLSSEMADNRKQGRGSRDRVSPEASPYTPRTYTNRPAFPTESVYVGHGKKRRRVSNDRDARWQ